MAKICYCIGSLSFEKPKTEVYIRVREPLFAYEGVPNKRRFKCKEIGTSTYYLKTLVCLKIKKTSFFQ